MSYLFILEDLINNKYNVQMLDILSIFIIIFGICIIINKNPIISILFLIALFGGVSSYLILIGLNFIGLSYLIIYIGAVSILFLFILMLINIRISELQNDNTNSLLLGLIMLIVLNFYVFQILPYSIAVPNNYSPRINDNLYIEDKDMFNSIENIYYANSSDWNGNLIDINNISNIGSIMYTSYNLWLIMTGFILLLAMVGTIIITIKKGESSREISSMVEQPFYTR